MDINQLNRQSYDIIAAEFNATRRFVWRDIELFRDYIKDRDKVLDLGCGNGRLAQLFVDKQVNYLGVDASEKMIEIAKKNYPDKNFAVMDALNLDLPEKSFDAVICVSTLNHFEKKEHQRFIENVKKILKPGGYLLMVNWNLWRLGNKKSIWRNREASHLFSRLKNREVKTTWRRAGITAPLYYYVFTKAELVKLLEQNKLRVIKNFYSKNGKKSNWLFGENIVTIANQ
jgi:ubiquinone/menaquinone biosynthesis C-methylase UbiE